VVYGGTPLWAGSGLFGRRLGQLIGLRDLARHVLQSQNEGWPQAHGEDARRELNRAYDRFVSAFGPSTRPPSARTRRARPSAAWVTS
jgi:hypothetical protein